MQYLQYLMTLAQRHGDKLFRAAEKAVGRIKEVLKDAALLKVLEMGFEIVVEKTRKSAEEQAKEDRARFEQLEREIAGQIHPEMKPEEVRGLDVRDLRDLIDSDNLFLSPRDTIARQVDEYMRLRKELGLLTEKTEEFEGKTDSAAKAIKDFGAAAETAGAGTKRFKEKITAPSEALEPEQSEEITKTVQEAEKSLALSPQTLEQFETLRDYICEAKRCMLELKQAAEEMKVPALPQGAGAHDEEEGFGDDDFEEFSTGYSPTHGETSFFPTQIDEKPAKSPGTISEEIGKANSAVAQLKNTFEALESGILQTLNGIFQGSQTFAEGMKNLFRNLALSLAQDILKLTVLDPLKKGLGSLLEGLSGGIAGGILSFFGFKAAQGGLLPGHFAPVRAFAGGGVIDRPTFGFVGEGGLPEAVVPLPDGRSIPVRDVGGRRSKEPQVSVLINGDITPRQPNMTPDQVVTVVVDNI